MGEPFVGPSGQTLREWFRCAGLDFNDFRRWNVCIDYKERNLKPLACEIERDRAEVVADIALCQPKVIVAVGVHAMRWCLETRSNLKDEHGKKSDVQIGDHPAICVPIYHPSRLNIRHAKEGKDDVLAVAKVLRG